MSYNSYRRPAEYASKSSHSIIINQGNINDFLKRCTYQRIRPDDAFEDVLLVNQEIISENPIKRVMCVDGGRTEVPIQEKFPSTKIAFFLYGMLYFDIESLLELYDLEFLGEEIKKINNIDSFNFILPTKNIRLNDCIDMKESFRKLFFEHFSKVEVDSFKLMDSLVWFIFREYDSSSVRESLLTTCSNCYEKGVKDPNVRLFKEDMEDYAFKCPKCGGTIYLTDVLKLHESVDTESASVIKQPLLSVLEQFLLIHYIKISLELNPSILDETLFIKDGPLAFFSDSSNLRNPMHHLIKFLFENHNIFLVGVEKSGIFVDYAHSIDSYLSNGTVMLLNSDYIYNYINFGNKRLGSYGNNTYYGSKIIFKSFNGKIYVLTIPTTTGNMDFPRKEHYMNLNAILETLTILKSDRYDDALLPINLINKNVSISDNPSSVILKKLAKNIK